MNIIKLRVDEIIVDPDRFRDATGDMEGLAQSILENGLLEPIIVEKTIGQQYRLLAGLRRLTAHRMNVMEHIFAIEKHNLTARQAKVIELEENIQREQMTVAEKLKAIAQIDELKRQEDPNWTQGQTAVVAGIGGQNRVSDAVQLSKAMQLFPELANAKSVNQMKSWLNTKVKQLGRVAEVKANPISYAAVEEKIWLGDSTELIKQVPDESFHAIITDPPFGVDYDKRTAGSEGSTLNSYKDTEELYTKILGMAPEMYRTLKPNGWVVFFYGMSWHAEVQAAFTQAGFMVDYAPFIWDRSGGRTFTTRPDHFYSRGYDVALIGRKGDAKIAIKNKPNIIRIDPVGSDERQYLVERPVELYEFFIDTLTIPGERVADFFVGSGSCPAAAARKRRDYFGIELNAERRAGALMKITAHTPST